LKLFYQLRVHRWGEWALERWAVTLTWGAAALLLARWLLRGRPAFPFWHWLIVGLLIGVGGVLIALARWAAARSYVIFEPRADLPAPQGQAFDPEDKVLHRATGRFEVEGKSHRWTNLLAYWRTFATREHAVMAIVHHTRFALLAHVPETDVGLWYIFFRPEDIQVITPGRLTFGAEARPALRVVYRIAPTARSGRGRLQERIVDTAHLAFDNEAALEKVWSDLLADSPT
jgi:hypothetical protein